MTLTTKNASKLTKYLKMVYDEKIEYKVKIAEVKTKIEYRIDVYIDDDKFKELLEKYHYLNIEYKI